MTVEYAAVAVGTLVIVIMIWKKLRVIDTRRREIEQVKDFDGPEPPNKPVACAT